MLFIVLPFTLVLGSIRMGISTFAISLIIFPLSLIDISVGMEQFTESVSLIIDPMPFIPRFVRPGLFPEAVPHIILPFTLVYSPTRESNGIFFNPFATFGWFSRLLVLVVGVDFLTHFVELVLEMPELLRLNALELVLLQITIGLQRSLDFVFVDLLY